MMASPLPADSSRASTPESPLAKAATTIDDLTTAMANFSRPHTPDPHIVCCCRREDCKCTKAWCSFRAKLESRLVLSAEVGQALLARHEAYVRRQDAALSREASSIFLEEDETSSLKQQVEYLTKKLDTVTEENTLLESRLNEVMIKHEMADASSRTLTRELQESRAAVGRLSAQNARSAGWEIRLTQLTQERDDIRQERDSEAQRARQADSKAAAFVDKCSRLQNEVYALREEVHNFRASREDFSKSVLQEARARLESLQHSFGRDRIADDPETTRVLESLVADNETLKRDVAELQNLLVESRDDVRTLREELEEHRASAPCLMDDITKVGTPPSSTLYIPRSPHFGRVRGYHPTNNAASPASLLYGLPHAPGAFTSSPRTPPSLGRSLSGSARLVGDEDDHTLLSLARPHSPADSLSPPDGRYNHLRHRHTPSRELEREGALASLEKHNGNIRPLLLLNRSCGVQTDPQIGHVYPSPRSSTLVVDRDSSNSTPAPEGSSDASSFSHQQQQDPRTVAALIEHVAGLLARMVQADVKTLTNRLKRQHLVSSDVGHVSHTTIGGILSEVANLRIHMAKDDAVAVSTTDLKALRKFFKDAFAELGALREQLNMVVLDPAVAYKLRKEALEGEARPASAMGGWIAPIQKLFSSPISTVSTSAADLSADSGGGGPAKGPASELGRGRAPARVVPKLAPAISATSTTVKVEFANTGVRKTDTSDGSLRIASSPAGLTHQQSSSPITLRKPIALPHTSSRQLMDIFAGAPHSFTKPQPKTGGWVVLQKHDKDRVRELKSAASSAVLGEAARGGRTATIGRSALRNPNRLSRNVDAVIDQKDDDVADFHETLLERTLRPRGYSDSSIHTSFMQGEPTSDSYTQKHESSEFSQEMDVATSPAQPGSISGTTSPPPAAFILDSPPAISKHRSPLTHDSRPRSPVARFGRNLASWATVAAGGINDMERNDHLFMGSPREDSILHHAWTRRGLEGPDF